MTRVPVEITRAMVRKWAERGLTQSEACRELGITRGVFYEHFKKLKMKWEKKAVRCRNGHDRREHSYVDEHGQKRCRVCAKQFQENAAMRREKLHKAKAEAKESKPETVMTPGAVVAKLDLDEWLETAPAWLKAMYKRK